MTTLIIFTVVAIILVALLVAITEMLGAPTEIEQLNASPTALEVEILLGCSLFGVTRLQAGGFRQQRYLPRDLFLRAVREGHNPRDTQDTLVGYAKKCGNRKSRKWVEQQIREVWELTEIPKDFPGEDDADRAPSGEPKTHSHSTQVLPVAPDSEDRVEVQVHDQSQDADAVTSADDEQARGNTQEDADTQTAAASEAGGDEASSDKQTASSGRENAQDDTQEHLLLNDATEFDTADAVKAKSKPPTTRRSRKKPAKSKKAATSGSKPADSV